jgi:hypothetical protein
MCRGHFLIFKGVGMFELCGWHFCNCGGHGMLPMRSWDVWTTGSIVMSHLRGGHLLDKRRCSMHGLHRWHV